MKFNVSSKVLYSATSAVSKVINTKNTLAILDNFLINLTAMCSLSPQRSGKCPHSTCGGGKGQG